MRISELIPPFLITLKSEEYSQRTLDVYAYQVASLADFLEDPEIEEVSTMQIREWLVFLRDDYRSARGRRLSAKSVYNYWTAMRSFFGWAQRDGLLAGSPADAVRPPSFESPPPDPYTQDEVRRVAEAAMRVGWQAYRNRNRAMVVMLVDTGLRSSELLGLKLRDVDFSRQRVWVVGKGNKGRHVPFGNATRRWLFRYLSQRGQSPGPLFLTHRKGQMSQQGLDDLLGRLGEHAGVPLCNAHRFRHTFALNFLRNGGNMLALKQILGHTTFEMVERYVQLAEADIEHVHRNASPGDKLGL